MNWRQRALQNARVQQFLYALAWPEIAKQDRARNATIDEMISKLPKKYTEEDLELFQVFKKLEKMTDAEVVGELAYDRAVDHMKKTLEDMKR